LLEELRRSAGRSANEPGDACLLRRFAVDRDEAAFAALVARFGPMVLAVCQRVLGDAHAAEDAFQATFLVLARKAPSLLRHDLVGNWLWGVAYRTARRARLDAARWHSRKREVQANSAPDPVEDVMWRDLRPVLDEEIHRLPEKYRQPFVLCYLEGKTNEEAARRLGCPPGTVFTRLARARELLRGQLTRRGITLAGAALVAAITREATACVPAGLARTTVQAAARFAAGSTLSGVSISTHAIILADGVLSTMSVPGRKVALVTLIAAATLVGGSALYAHRLLGDVIPTVECHTAESNAAPDRSPAARAEQEPGESIAVSSRAPAGEQDDRDPPRERVGFGFGKGSGRTGDCVTATVTVNNGKNTISVSVSAKGSSKLAALSRQPIQRELGLSDQQLQRLHNLQDEQERTLRAVEPRDATDAAQAGEVIEQMERAAEQVKKLAREIDQTIDTLLTAEQGQRLRQITSQDSESRADDA
jgi:RNA polymerase sigma factor (sigma-70 family)